MVNSPMKIGRIKVFHMRWGNSELTFLALCEYPAEDSTDGNSCEPPDQHANKEPYKRRNIHFRVVRDEAGEDMSNSYGTKCIGYSIAASSKK